MVLILKDKLGICGVGILHAGNTTGKNYKGKKGEYTHVQYAMSKLSVVKQ